MNITFFIGNGFDIAQGLRTSYDAFYQYYTNEKHNPHDCISNRVDIHSPDWADLEEKLGSLFDENEGSEEFFDAKDILEDVLTEYLLTENSAFLIQDENKLAEELRDNITKRVIEELNTEDANYYSSFINNARDSVQYHFINFNYTNTIDRIIEVARKAKVDFGNHKVGNNVFHHEINVPLHIHGSLDTNDIILAVDNEGQLSSTTAPDYYKNMMVKTALNHELGENRVDKMNGIINGSTFIFVFGMSYGKTDLTWWKKLVKWLQENGSRRLVLYHFSKGLALHSAGSLIRFNNKVRRMFLDRAECFDDSLRDSLMRQIIVVKNTRVFYFKNIQIKRI